jgi:hypothetical protein
MPTAIAHAPPFTVPGSSTSTALVRWSGTGGNQIQDSTILVGATTMGLAADTDLVTFSNGTLTIAGTVAATTLTGAGAGITALAAANITASGTLPALNGSALTALNATNLGSGTVPVARLSAASTTASGIAELATTAEINTGTDTGRIVTPDGLAGSVHGEKTIQMVVIDFATALTTGNGKFYFHVPSTLNGFNIVDVHAEVITAPVGSTIIIQLHNLTATADILTTLLTIDASETGSDTAAAAAVISGSEDDLTTNDVIRVDIDQIGSSTAGSGLIVTLICRLP